VPVFTPLRLQFCFQYASREFAPGPFQVSAVSSAFAVVTVSYLLPLVILQPELEPDHGALPTIPTSPTKRQTNQPTNQSVRHPFDKRTKVKTHFAFGSSCFA